MCAAGSSMAPTSSRSASSTRLTGDRASAGCTSATSKTPLVTWLRGPRDLSTRCSPTSTTISNGATASPARPALNYYRTGVTAWRRTVTASCAISTTRSSPSSPRRATAVHRGPLGGGPATTSPRSGDLLVMGGTAARLGPRRAQGGRSGPRILGHLALDITAGSTRDGCQTGAIPQLRRQAGGTADF